MGFGCCEQWQLANSVAPPLVVSKIREFKSDHFFIMSQIVKKITLIVLKIREFKNFRDDKYRN